MVIYSKCSASIGGTNDISGGDLLDQPKGVALINISLLDEIITTLADKDTVMYAVLLFDELSCDFCIIIIISFTTFI